MRSISLILHIVGVVLWIGASVGCAWTAMQLNQSSPEVRGQGLTAVRKSLLAIATPGMLLAIGAGLVVLISDWEIYRRAPWMHIKFTIGFVLAGVAGVLSARLRRAASGEKPVSTNTIGGFAAALLLGALVIVVLVVLRPGT